MIFDCDAITPMVVEWQTTRSNETLEDIMVASRGLIEAIVSKFDSIDRDDLIQEAYVRLQYAMPFFDKNISSLHNFFTTVIKNVCITYIKKQQKENFEDIDLLSEGQFIINTTDYDDTLQTLIVRNRIRFPSIPVHEIDDITEYIYYHIEDIGNTRSIVRELMNRYSCTKDVATVIWQSTVAYLRYTNISCAEVVNTPIGEFSLLEDLRLMLGDKVFYNVYTAMFKYYVHFK